MLFIDDDRIREALDYPQLIEALRKIFLSEYTMKLRHHHFYQSESGSENALILMPVWNKEFMGIKQVIVAPDNHKIGLPSISAQYTLLDTQTGRVLALMNATELTARRTACTSALAASYLAPLDASDLLVVGGGSVAKHLVQAHNVVRNYTNIKVWMRNPDKKQVFVKELQDQGYSVEAAEDLEAAVKQADVISCATLSADPIIKGSWIKKGTHLDLIGSHKPDTREVDDEAISRAAVFVDSRMGALHETGELAIPIASGLLKEEDVLADITQLVSGQHPGRRNKEEITLFKSAGLAVEDLAAALLVYQTVVG